MPFRKIARAFTKMLGTWRGSYRHTGVQTIAPRAKEGRDAVRASEARSLRPRELSGVQDEFLLATTAQNLRRMANRLTPLGNEMIAMAV
ncbi:hypothetical protein [Burkholderia stabilis]|uniref:hypothetical protein n=1 Tax=Burkholderia stabilis TaxID=95485 RepID=UPI00196B145E|nr:hypothetical protein [Burkholderia stabilis]